MTKYTTYTMTKWTQKYKKVYLYTRKPFGKLLTKLLVTILSYSYFLTGFTPDFDMLGIINTERTSFYVDVDAVR